MIPYDVGYLIKLRLNGILLERCICNEETKSRTVKFLSSISTSVCPGWHARHHCTLQVAELLQHPDGAAGAATAHDVQGEHEASAATRGPDLHQLNTPPPFCFCHFTPILHHGNIP